ncbi:NtaA/DmoA family FMN-dependent monooxygenase [Frigidibacter mobilis]|uniref:NtaA/SnaA/SoxA family monooxygenase n=1 Tax=Frigidibacter mobilis TaxID=1335048 RepID=A0A165SV91_9RHOB|nr:NtaA/DmoA family FMN-dependent monooxygenase [Frigidibacter mobilis]AMY71489.1 NtaA/SnaA/SoxA family monooxygenase [Frigidibacter mobilis]
MVTTRALCIGMSLAPTWLSGEGWRSPDSGIDGLYSGALAVQTAKAAEAAHLDFVFLPDTLSLTVEPMAQSFGFASLDPTLLMASLAHQTRKIGLVTTISTTFGHPYHVARQLMSLHWLSGGRAGWNIVTALQGHENFGLDRMPDSAARYARAAEFTAAVRALWASFPAEALIVDRAAGRFADTARLGPADHAGPDFRVKGPLNLPGFPGPRLPLVQAGASGPGRDFAASVADLVFAPTPDMEAALELRADLSARAIGHGRAPADLRLLPGLSLYLAPTRREAEDLFHHTHSRLDPARRIARFREATGLDLTDWPSDRPVTLADLPEPASPPKTQTHADLMRRMIARDAPLPEDLLSRPELLSASHWQIVGTPEQACAEIRRWHAAGAIDGFICTPGGAPSSRDLALNELMPRLAEAGLFRKAYASDSFLGHLGSA